MCSQTPGQGIHKPIDCYMLIQNLLQGSSLALLQEYFLFFSGVSLPQRQKKIPREKIKENKKHLLDVLDVVLSWTVLERHTVACLQHGEFYVEFICSGIKHIASMYQNKACREGSLNLESIAIIPMYQCGIERSSCDQWVGNVCVGNYDLAYRTFKTGMGSPSPTDI